MYRNVKLIGFSVRIGYYLIIFKLKGRKIRNSQYDI